MRVLQAWVLGCLIGIGIACESRRLADVTTPSPAPRTPITFSLSGVVAEGPFRKLADVTIEVSGTPPTTTLTDAEGRFSVALTRLPKSAFGVTVSKEGYKTFNTGAVSPPASGAIIEIPFVSLWRPSILRVDEFESLTISADDSCALPPLVRSWTYRTSMSTGGGPGSVAVQLGRIPGTPQGFEEPISQTSGLVSGDGLSIFVGHDDGFIGIVSPFEEAVTDSSYINLLGYVVATGGAQEPTLTGRFDGNIDYCPTRGRYSACAVALTQCASRTHEAVLRRH